MRIDRYVHQNELKKVLKRYKLVPQKIKPVRGVLQIQTESGNFALKRSASSLEQISFVQETLEELSAVGYEHLLPWVRTRSGEPFVHYEGGIWYLTPWFGEEKESGFVGKQAEQLVQLARFHRLSQSIAAAKTSFQQPVGEAQITQWEQQRNRLNHYLEKIEEREFRSPFDNVFINNIDYLDKAITFAIRGMERFVKTENGYPPRWTVCHGRLDPRNVVYGDKGWKWIDWDHARVASPVRDLAAYFRRFPLEKEGLDFHTALSYYEREWELTSKEKKLLALYLAYPERPFRLLRHYYEKSLSVSEADSVQLLEQEMKRLQQVQGFIRTLWPTRKNKQQVRANKKEELLQLNQYKERKRR